MRNITFICFLVFSASMFAQSTSWPRVEPQAKPYMRWSVNVLDTIGLSKRFFQLSRVGINDNEISPISEISKEWTEMLSSIFMKSSKQGINLNVACGLGWPTDNTPVSIGEASSKLILLTFDASEGQYVDKKITPNLSEQQNVTGPQVVMAFSNKGTKVNLTSKVKTDGKLNWMPGEGKWKIVAAFESKIQRKVKYTTSRNEEYGLDYYSGTAVDNYIQRFDKAFSAQKSSFPKIFYSDSYQIYSADWSSGLFKAFKARKGYNLEDHLDLFAGFGNPGEVASLKSDYREVLSGMLLENFSERWVKWAQSKGAITRISAYGLPGNIIDLYATADIPFHKFDTAQYFLRLTKDTGNINTSQVNPFMLKFASSAAHISGKRYVSSEAFAVSDTSLFSLAECKPQLDELFYSGMNQVYFHEKSFMSKDVPETGMKIDARMDFPVTSSIWTNIEATNAYITKCQSFLQMGQPDNDFLLYFPIFDIWYNEKGTVFPLANNNVDQWLLNSKFYKAAKLLADKGFSFDYISDMYLHKANTSSGKVNIGGNNYKAVIVPMSRFMPYETLKKIIDLARNGATVLFVEMPSDVPGLIDVQNKKEDFQVLIRELALMPYKSKDKLAPFDKGWMAISGSLERMLGYLNLPHESFSDFKIQYIRRKNEAGYHYFMVNRHSQPLNAWIDLAVEAKQAVLFDPVTGKRGDALTRVYKGKFQTLLQLEPGESLILRTYSSKINSGNKWQYVQANGNPI